jgi:glutamate N-acetyltransferase/amino-acid N-acetyltransferase
METQLIDVPDGTITTPQGFLAGATEAGIRDPAPGHLDLALLTSERRCAAAAVYTTNRFQAAPIGVTQRHLADGQAQAVIANSGCANALTGRQGLRDAKVMAELAAAKLGVGVEDVVVASTGVTGWAMPMERIRAGVGHIIPTEDGGDAFAHAIMTTDTVAKQAAVRFEHDGVAYAVGGAAKGSGMIHVDMATMLAFLTTDAPVDPGVVPSLLRETVDASFNMLTIDGDTSTNDMVLLLANGAAGGKSIGARHPALAVIGAALQHVATALTRKLARDGEGASKLLEVRVSGGRSAEEARRAAKAVAGSMLVKAAVYGCDPNWGRVLVALGYSGARVREDRLVMSIQDVEVCRDGAPVPFDEAALSQALTHSEVHLDIELGAGRSSATAWGCDLTPEYVRINSEYTT